MDDYGYLKGEVKAGQRTDDLDLTFKGQGLTKDQEVIVKAVLESGDVVALGTATVRKNGSWSISPNLSFLQEGMEGVVDFFITVVDVDGVDSVDSDPIKGVVVDRARPEIELESMQVLGGVQPVTIDGAQGQAHVNAQRPVFEGKFSEPASPENLQHVRIVIKQGGRTIFSFLESVGEDGSWRYTWPDELLGQAGDYTLLFYMMDAAGNSPVNPDLIDKPFQELTLHLDYEAPDDVVSFILHDDFGPVHGPVAAGGKTDDATPTLIGKVELSEGSDVESVAIYVDGSETALGTALVDGEGNWSFESPELAIGEHVITVVPVDGAGNEGNEASIAFEVVDPAVSPDAPVISEIVDDHGSVTGLLNDGDVTDDNNLTVNGTANAGDIVLLYVNGELVASTTADEQGNWTAELPLNGDDGEQVITAKAQDDAGRQSTETAPVSVILDTTPPAKPEGLSAEDDEGVVQGAIIDGGATNDSRPELSGQAEPGSTVIISDNGEPLGSVVADAEGNWSYTPETPLADGEHSITAQAQDAAGNLSEPSDALEFSVWSEAPQVQILHALDAADPVTGPVADNGSTNDNRPTLVGTATAGALVIISEAGIVLGSVQADTEGNWSLQLPLSQGDGPHTYRAEVQSATGEFGRDEITLLIDTRAPDQPTIDTVLDDVGAVTGALRSGDTTDDNTPTLKGSDAEPNGLVMVYDNGGLEPIASTTADENGNWSLDLPELADGEHRLTVTTSDAAGNESNHSNPFELTVDTVVPADLRIDRIELVDDFGPVTGMIANGGTTDDATPLVQGHVEGEAAYVEVYDGETLLGTAAVDAEGNWSFQAPELASGEHAISVRPVNAIGQVGEASDSIAFTLVGEETPLPTLPVISEILDDLGSVTGLLNDGDVTDDTSLTVSGTADAGNLVLLYVNGELAASVVADEQGNWTAELPLTGDGEQVITAKAQDDAGRHSDETAPVSVILDTTAPEQPGMVTAEDNTGAITGPIEPGSVTDETQPTLSGSGEPGDTVSILDNGEVIGTVVIDENGQWEFTPEQPLEEGDHSIGVVITDPAGNASEPSESLDFVVDSLPAFVTIDAAIDQVGSITGDVVSGGVTDDARPTLKGTANPGAVVIIKEGPVAYGSVVADAEGNWSMRLPLVQADGEHLYTAEVQNATGGSAQAEFTLLVDTRVPDRPVIDAVLDNVGLIQGPLTSGAVTDDATPTLKGGDAEPNGVVRIYDGKVEIGSTTADEFGEWSIELAELADGKHVLSVKAEDGAGNQSNPSRPFELTVDTAAANLVIDSIELVDDFGPVTGLIADGDKTDDTTPLLQGHVEGEAKYVEVYDGETLLGTAAVDAQGNWSFQAPELESGEHAFSAVPVDALGKTGEASESIRFEVVGPEVAQPNAPVISEILDDQGSVSGLLNDGDVTDDTSLSLKGTADAGNLVMLYVNGELAASVVADEQGNWTAELPLAGDGEHVITAKAQDEAGRHSDETAPVSVILDTTAPEQPGMVTAEDNTGAITGPIEPGSVTDETQPTLSGSGEPGDTVSILDNGEVIGSVVIDENGQWEFTPEQPLEEGEHSISVVVTDPAGNASEPSESLDFSVDTSVSDLRIDRIELVDDFGEVQGLIADGGKTDDTTPLLQGHVEGANAAWVEIYDGETLLGTALVDAEGNWAFQSAELATGEYVFSAVPVDTIGKQGEPSENIRFEVVGPEVAPPQPPAIDEIRDDLGSVTGLLNDGDLTDDTSLSLKGTAEAGHTVLLYVDGELAASVVADEQGNWTAELPLAGDGEHVITAKAQDEAGRHSDETAPVSITLDTTAPEQPGMVTAEDNTGAITGPIEPGSVTDETQPTLSGSGEPGDTVSILDNGEVIGTVVIDENGQWEFTPEQPLEEGDHSISVVVTDPAGNASEPSESLDFSVDTSVEPMVIDRIELIDDVGPVTGAIVNGDSTDDATPLVQGHVEGEAAWVEIYDGETLLGTALVDGDGNWSFQAPELESGEHSISARPVNAIGQVGEASESIGFTVVGEETPLPQPPVIDEIRDDLGSVTGLLNDGDVTDDTSLSLKGSADAGNLVLLYVGGVLAASAVADENGNWSAELPLVGDGEQVITAKAQDDAGRHSDETAPVSVILDTTAPEQPGMVTAEDNTGAITGPIEPGSVTDETQPTLSGSGEPGDTVSILDNGEVIGTVVIDENGQWEFTPEQPLEEGDHSISVMVTDPAGNASEPSESLDFTVQAQVPTLSLDSVYDDVEGILGEIAQGGLTNDAQPTLSGTAGNGAVRVLIHDGQTLLGSALVDGNGNWQFELPELADGEYSLSLVAETASGTPSESLEWSFTVDTQAPDAVTALDLVDDVPLITGSIEQDGLTNDATPTFSGQAPGAKWVNVYDGDTLLGSAAVDAEGNWSFTPDEPLSEGTHQFIAAAVDEAGNEGERSAGWNFTVDVTAPGRVTNLGLYDMIGPNPETDWGDIPNGGKTDDPWPNFYGQVDTFGVEYIYIYDNGTFLGSATVNQLTLEWAFEPYMQLATGSHSFQACAVDAAGNMGPLSDAWDFTVAIPVSPYPSIINVHDDVAGVYLQKEDFTEDTNLTVKVSCAPGNLVTLYANGVAVGSHVVDEDGYWTFSTGELAHLANADGSVDLVVGAEDLPSSGPYTIFLEDSVLQPQLLAEPYEAGDAAVAGLLGALAVGQEARAEAKPLSLADLLQAREPAAEASAPELLSAAAAPAAPAAEPVVFDNPLVKQDLLALQQQQLV
ncbi:Ig-like domain-containing protein [Pseudomonas citronellolis]|uniref:Ig-like domain-containing protein n=1 Tax=Pseudomonas citronellolis TaxID=53408 RepID=UPI000853A9C8|nr:Ig-like domain-containing protein [Pseudomonas humi]